MADVTSWRYPSWSIYKKTLTVPISSIITAETLAPLVSTAVTTRMEISRQGRWSIMQVYWNVAIGLRIVVPAILMVAINLLAME